MQRFPNFHRVRLFKFKTSTDGAEKGEQELEEGGNETYAGRDIAEEGKMQFIAPPAAGRQKTYLSHDL